MFVSQLRRKAESAGASIEEFPTRHTMLSRICHGCGVIIAKPLSERWHRCECGISAQRDLYSAFLAACVENNLLNAGQAMEYWPGVDSLLQAALRTTQLASSGDHPASFGLGRSQSQSPVIPGKPTSEACDAVAGNRESARELVGISGTPWL
jgi:hypothetical protein